MYPFATNPRRQGLITPTIFTHYKYRIQRDRITIKNLVLNARSEEIKGEPHGKSMPTTPPCMNRSDTESMSSPNGEDIPLAINPYP